MFESATPNLDKKNARPVFATEKGFHDSTQDLKSGVEAGEVDFAAFEDAQNELAEGEVMAEPATAEIMEYTPEQIAKIRQEAAAIINMIKPLESQVRSETALQAELAEQEAQLSVEVQGGMTEELLQRLAQLRGSRTSNEHNLAVISARLAKFKEGFFGKYHIPYDVVEGD